MHHHLRAQTGTWLATVFAVVLSACAAIPSLSLKPPTLGFQDFDVTSLGLQNIQFALTIRAENPNTVAIPVNNLNFDLDLFGKSFASGKTQHESVNLPAQESRDVKVDFVIPTGRLISLLQELRTAKLENLSYELRGETRWGPNGITLPFERKGSLNLLRQLQQLVNPITESKT